MSDMNRSFAGSMPEFYDRILVPVMFEPFALDLAERLRGMNFGQILELACGTGVVTRALARLLTQMPDRLGEITDAAGTVIAARFGSGPIDAPLRALLFIAVRPNE